SVRKKGFIYVRVDGEVQEIYQGMKVDRYKNHTIEVVVDRLKMPMLEEGVEPDLIRLRQSVDKAMLHGNGMLLVCCDEQIRYFSKHLMCPQTGISYREPAPHSFSFNSPQGWCPRCKGLGRIRIDNDLTDEWTDILHDEEHWYARMFDYVEQNKESEDGQEEWTICPECQGKRLNKEALHFKILDRTIADLSELDIDALMAFLKDFQNRTIETEEDSIQKAIAEPIIKEILTRLQFMSQVGLEYLSLSRPADSLSGGESQRIRLATQIGSRLVNVLYILDEPSIGLHQRDNARLIDSLKELRDMGNTVIVVEHDEQMMREADYVIDIGPKAGRLGGEIMFQGTPQQMLQANTLTAKYLTGECVCSTPSEDHQEADKWLTLSGCKGNNLKDIEVSFPLGKLIGITGVSGSGKSTLINHTLYPILSKTFHRSLLKPLAYTSIEGMEWIDKVIAVDQSPIGRSPRSNPATYTNVFNDIRELFAQLPEAKIRGWKSGRFSFNSKGGRCEECAGNGYKTLQMHFMPDVYVPCEACAGKRYNRETLEVRFRGKTIFDILDMTVNQAVEFFDSQPTILKKIKTIQTV
ncbi:MAG: excinuclease ABC subunit UvrA, partial [Paludibacteraceae bacterium]|nr:excinuclease ABC subunit UvrA [Paludibacteraceae bacterium]